MSSYGFTEQRLYCLFYGILVVLATASQTQTNTRLGTHTVTRQPLSRVLWSGGALWVVTSIHCHTQYSVVTSQYVSHSCPHNSFAPSCFQYPSCTRAVRDRRNTSDVKREERGSTAVGVRLNEWVDDIERTWLRSRVTASRPLSFSGRFGEPTALGAWLQHLCACACTASSRLQKLCWQGCCQTRLVDKPFEACLNVVDQSRGHRLTKPPPGED